LAHSDVRWIATSAGDAASGAWIVPKSIFSSGRGLRVTIGKSDPRTLRFFKVRTNEIADSGSIFDSASRTELFVRNISGEVAVRLTGEKPGIWVPLSVYR